MNMEPDMHNANLYALMHYHIEYEITGFDRLLSSWSNRILAKVGHDRPKRMLQIVYTVTVAVKVADT